MKSAEAQEDATLRYHPYTTEQSPLPMVAVEGLTHLVRYVNPAFCLLAGADGEALLGRPFAEMMRCRRENGGMALLDRVYRTGRAENITEQERSEAASAPVYWSYEVWAVLGEEGRPSGLMIHVTDTTEIALFRLQVIAMNEELLLSGIKQQELAETAQKVNVRLHRAILETHHRVRNNLQMVAALAEMQIDTDSLTIPASALERITTHVGTLAALHDLLTQRLKIDAEEDTFDAQIILPSLMPLLQTDMGAPRLDYTIASVPLRFADGAAIAMLVSELVGNALKHGKGRIAVTLQHDGQEAHLEVSDEGPGFASGFDPHTASHTGLDLVMSIAGHDLRGKVQFTNQHGGGARVLVTFPLPLFKPA